MWTLLMPSDVKGYGRFDGTLFDRATHSLLSSPFIDFK